MKYTILRTFRAHGTCLVGDTVYAAVVNDFGLARDDTNHTGVEYVSVTMDPDGRYPLFTIPLEDLARIE